MKLHVGMKAPDILLPAQDGQSHRLKDYLGKWVVLYFYPKDDTPGCTVEACGFRDQLSKIKKTGAVVLGVSVDPIKKHERFAEKYQLNFPLLSDEEKKVVQAYGVWGKKRFMGREYMGTHRVSFLVDPRGRICKVYDAVTPITHAKEVLADIKSFQRATL